MIPRPPEQRQSDVAETDGSVAGVALLPHWAATASPQLVQLELEHVQSQLPQLEVLGGLQRLRLVLAGGQELGDTLAQWTAQLHGVILGYQHQHTYLAH